MNQSTKTRYNKDASGRRIRGHRQSTGKRIEENLLEIWVSRILARYRYASTPMLWALLPPNVKGKNYKAFQHRMTDLFHENNNPYGAAYVDWPREQDFYKNAEYRSGIWMEGEGSRACLKAHGLVEHPRDFLRDAPHSQDGHFAHSMMTVDTLQSIEAGANADPNAEFIGRQELYDRYPDFSFAIPVSISHQFPGAKEIDQVDFEYTPDALCGVRYLLEDGRKVSAYFVEESECKNRVFPSNLEITSWLKKYLALRYIVKNRLYQKHWGIDTLLVLTVTPTDSRIDTMINQCIRPVTQDRGNTNFLFHSIPALSYKYPGPHGKAPPMPDLYTSPWRRGGYNDFYINNPSNDKVKTPFT